MKSEGDFSVRSAVQKPYRAVQITGEEQPQQVGQLKPGSRGAYGVKPQSHEKDCQEQHSQAEQCTQWIVPARIE